jgi:hypothetical protein
MLELPKAEAPKAEETSKKNARKKKAKPTQEQLPDPDYIPDQPDDNGLSPQPTPQPANGSQQRQTLPVTLPVISEGRVRRFYAIVSAKGWTKAQAKDIVNQVCAPLVIESADQIPVKFYDQICAALEKGRKHA